MDLSRGALLRQAWPIILANASGPLLGLADTAVLGHRGRVEALGAVALGALVFSFLYWSFGFLRMGTSGFTAQAAGAGDEAEVRATIARALGVAVGLGVLVLALRPLVGSGAMALLSGSAEVEALALSYIETRIWGAPASLASFALIGTLIGLGESRALLAVQLFLNGLNIGLDILFAGVWDLGVEGIALGTAIAEWTAFALALAIVVRRLRDRHGDAEPFLPWGRIRDASRLRSALEANTDILIRTLFLVFGFSWFTDQSARFSDTVLAANHILLQFLAFSAFFLDAYAFVVEEKIGAAVGAGRPERFDLAVRRTSELAGLTAAVLAGGILLAGPLAVAALTSLAEVQAQAVRTLPYAALYVILAFPAFQLDGIFIGATRTRDMRNASVASVVVFLVAWWLLEGWEEDGLWLAFTVYVIARAVTLLARYPALRRSIR